MPLSRKNFIAQSACIMAGCIISTDLHLQKNKRVMTVNGWMDATEMGFTLTHEHILVDFIGADKTDPARYNEEDVFRVALPQLLSVKDKGCNTIIECTPAYIGRDVKLIKRLSRASGLNMVTNTGYYGAAGEKYLPPHAYTETAEQLAKRWIGEWENGINGSGVKPGFIKSGVDNYPLSAVQQKIIEAAAITHLATGLTIGVHTGNGLAAMEELRIIQSKKVAAEAWIWIHAQNETNREIHYRAAKAGGWVSFDSVNTDSLSVCLDFLKDMKNENLLGRVLLSHDSGWYHVGEPGGGNFNNYNTILDKLIPAMKQNGFTEQDIRQLFFINPSDAFAISVRRK